MRLSAFALCLLHVLAVCHASDIGKAIVVDKSKFSEIYPAVWFSPSTGEITPLKKMSEVPPEAKYEIWIEPDDPEFGYNPEKEPKGVGFALLGKGLEVFKNPVIPEKPRLKLKLTHFMGKLQGSENPVFYCKAKTSECLIMITVMDKEEGIISFRWRPLRKASSAEGRGRPLTLEQRLEAVAPVFESFGDALAKIASKYPEMTGHRKERAIGKSEDALWCEHSHNFKRPTVKRGIGPSDFGENGFTVSLSCKAMPPPGTEYAMPEPALSLKALWLYVWTEARAAPDPSPGLLKEVRAILQSHLEKLKAIDARAPAIRPGRPKIGVSEDLSAPDFRTALVGRWTSAYTYKGKRNIQALELGSRGNASLVIAHDGKLERYSGPYAVSFDREPRAGAVTLATITIKPDESKPIALPRVSFGLHNGVHYKEGLLLRIDVEPCGVLKRAD